MTTERHIAALQRRHQELANQIEEELHHTAHDETLIRALKRKKLEVKDELERARHRQAA